MKFWEALKAVDEGKTVEFKGPILGTWRIWVGTSYSTELRTLMSWEWRIKSEPRTFYIFLRNNGESACISPYMSKESADAYLANLNRFPNQHTPYTCVEVVERL